ncbi:peptidoglycan recognition protein family protein [Pelosinus propionicus]|uniref:N-acetylmuramoyl-L-alanine amidase n=1 Tax=Pelosinus propionicus DSM 13327 TaxID=1123291 RepID=A0A1I4M697_9FIRM|nr:N-acetylmuramoyl-L-alanine amidase [Pelosinus propionicus]SFL98739.1 N-acetylmuramoyl-L-alanine amidase [Pelosinus propionicus DSM 13327]
MMIPSELQLFFWVLGSLLAANISMMAFFVLFAKLSESKLKGVIRRIILELDALADNIENSEKRNRAIQRINETLGWKRFVIPSILIGWVTDMEVADIRKMQQDIDASSRADTRQVTLTELKQLALQSKKNLWSAADGINRDVKLYLHWSAGYYGQFFDEYHINIDQDGSIHVTTNDFSQIKSHTYKRNTASIGICLACGYGATPDNLGSEPPTALQIESMSQVIAVLCKALDLTIDIYRVMTHAEAANNLDGLNPGYESNGYPDGKYGPGFSWERWDLWYIPGVAKGEGGNVLRGKAIWYQYNGVGL